jgi:hypothetical protein
MKAHSCVEILAFPFQNILITVKIEKWGSKFSASPGRVEWMTFGILIRQLLRVY